MIKVLGISGSLRRGSYNAALLRAATRLMPEDTTLEEAGRILFKAKVEKLLLVDKDGRLAGLITMRDIDKMQQYPHACKDKRGRLRVVDFVNQAWHIGDAGLDGGSQAFAAGNQLIASIHRAHKKRLHDAVSGDRARERFEQDRGGRDD